MARGRENNKNNTDIIFIYKILHYLAFHGKCESKWYLASKSGSGSDKTPRLLKNLISKGYINPVFKKNSIGNIDDGKIRYFEITEKGKSVYLEIENLLLKLDTNIIPENKKERFLLAY